MSKHVRKTIMCPNCWTIINYDVEVPDALIPLTAWPLRKLAKVARNKYNFPPYYCPNCNTFFNP